MKKQSFFLLLLLFILQTSFTQTLSPIIKPYPGFDYKRLAQIDAISKQYVDNKWLVGSVVLVVKDNQVVYYKGQGYADAASKKPMPADAIFRIMSQTKAITSLGILQLYEQGKLSLDQHISDFIPEFKNPKVLKDFNPADSSYTTIPAKREITFRDLLTHTSGIDYAGIGSDKMVAIYAKAGIPSGLGSFKTNLLSEMKKLGTLPLVHQPGEKWTYGLNADLLGCLIEVISGKSLEAYFKENIFEPLGMKDTYFNVPVAKANRLPTVYTEDEQNNIIPWSPTFRNLNPNYPLIPKTFFSGGAGLSSTAFDYAVFLQMLLNGGSYNGKQILGRRTVELMISPQLDDNLFGNDNFSLGFSITSEKSANLNMRNKGSFSWGGYYGTTYWADPKEKLICLIMTQHTPNSHGDYAGKIENVIYGSLKNK
jgi:CubicO group peptidase (beta-lactamase class C family)